MINEKLLKELGFKKIWFSDKSAFWWESKLFRIEGIRCKISVDNCPNKINLEVYILKDDCKSNEYVEYKDTVVRYNYSDKKIKQLVKKFKLK